MIGTKIWETQIIRLEIEALKEIEKQKQDIISIKEADILDRQRLKDEQNN